MAWWPCTLRVAMVFLPRSALMLKEMSLAVMNSLPFMKMPLVASTMLICVDQSELDEQITTWGLMRCNSCYYSQVPAQKRPSVVFRQHTSTACFLPRRLSPSPPAARSSRFGPSS